ncbi:MAG: phosphoribosylformylglycinamidine synthase, partial [Spirochaetia bacterium]|nr:phosphoribosylformylglycinamidine synthase [Spirochaetia bacterium]
VQIGDPITQKKMIDFLLEARDLGLFEGITDNGAGGLSSSVGEMARESGGCRMDLSKAPLKYPGLKPWEILISEAQERMTLSVAPKKIKALQDLALKREVEVSVIGEFTKTGFFHILHGETTVAFLEMEFLHDGLPKLVLEAEWKTPVHPKVPDSVFQIHDHAEALKQILSRPNVASKEFWVRQYDHEVQARTVVKPFEGPHRDGPSDAAVIRPVYASQQGLVVACGLAPRYSDLDARAMTLASVDEAVRNIVATGGDPKTLTGLDNFCWPDPVAGPDNPDGSFKMAQLVRSNEALQEICLAYGIPLISGKDSMKNDYGKGADRISVPPTLLFTAAARIPDVRLAMTSPFKKTGSSIYLLGRTLSELGGSEFLSGKGFVGNAAPTVDLKTNFKMYQAFHKAILKGLVLAAHDLSDGGLGVALAEMCFGGMLGAEIDLSKVPGSKTLGSVEILYSESQGRLLAEVSPGKQKAFESLLRNIPFAKIGATHSDSVLQIKSGGNLVLSTSLAGLKAAWKNTLIF